MENTAKTSSGSWVVLFNVLGQPSSEGLPVTDLEVQKQKYKHEPRPIRRIIYHQHLHNGTSMTISNIQAAFAVLKLHDRRILNSPCK